MDGIQLGKALIGLGLGLLALGAMLIAIGKGLIPHLPGDISFKVGQTRVFFPIVTCLLVSVIASVAMHLGFARARRPAASAVHESGRGRDAPRR